MKTPEEWADDIWSLQQNSDDPESVLKETVKLVREEMKQHLTSKLKLYSNNHILNCRWISENDMADLIESYGDKK